MRLNIIPLYIFVLILTGCSSGELNPESLSKLKRVGSITPNECHDKDLCVTVFLAPWCPACKTAYGTLNELDALLRDQPRIGMQVVVGWDDPEALQSLARRHQGEVFLDIDSTFRRSVGVRGVPSFLVYDRNFKIRERFSSGAPRGGTHETRMNWLIDKLKIRGYMSQPG